MAWNDRRVAIGFYQGTTNRSLVYREYQLSIKKEDRLKESWSLEQYGQKYHSALAAVVKAANPNWKNADSFDPSILDSVTRESVESQLVKSGNKLVKKPSSGGTLDMKI